MKMMNHDVEAGETLVITSNVFAEHYDGNGGRNRQECVF